MRKYIGHRLVARPELDNTFWTASTCFTPKKMLHRGKACKPYSVEQSGSKSVHLSLNTDRNHRHDSKQVIVDI